MCTFQTNFLAQRMTFVLRYCTSSRYISGSSLLKGLANDMRKPRLQLYRCSIRLVFFHYFSLWKCWSYLHHIHGYIGYTVNPKIYCNLQLWTTLSANFEWDSSHQYRCCSLNVELYICRKQHCRWKYYRADISVATHDFSYNSFWSMCL